MLRSCAAIRQNTVEVRKRCPIQQTEATYMSNRFFPKHHWKGQSMLLLKYSL